MGVGIHCLLEPEVFSANKFKSDGKNLAQAFMADAMGDSEPSSEGMFDALMPLMGGTLSGGEITWREPEVGLAAIAETKRKLKDPAAERLIPDADLRAGCIYDLEAANAATASLFHARRLWRGSLILEGVGQW